MKVERMGLIKKTVFSIRKYGISTTAKRIIAFASEMMHPTKYYYEFALLPAPQAWREEPLQSGQLEINWYIPEFEVGSGGHMTVFRLVRFLREFGHHHRIVLVPPTKLDNRLQLKSIVTKHFLDLGDTEFFLWGEEVPACDISVATGWQTAYFVNAQENTKQKFYLVQDYEPMFYPMSSSYILAENTYKMKLRCIAASPWLAKMLQVKYGTQADFFSLAYSPEEYYPQDRNRELKTVTFYARHCTERRGFELGILALQLVKRTDPDIKIILYGAEGYPCVPFECEKRGILSQKELAYLYNTATVGLVISLTNYSLIPNEMMACKLPVVDMKTECTNTMYADGEEIILAQPEPRAIADAILNLVGDPGRRALIAEKAYEKVITLSWEKAARRVEEILLGSHCSS